MRKILRHLNLWERPQRSPPHKLYPHKLETFLVSLSPAGSTNPNLHRFGLGRGPLASRKQTPISFDPLTAEVQPKYASVILRSHCLAFDNEHQGQTQISFKAEELTNLSIFVETCCLGVLPPAHERKAPLAREGNTRRRWNTCKKLMRS